MTGEDNIVAANSDEMQALYMQAGEVEDAESQVNASNGNADGSSSHVEASAALNPSKTAAMGDGSGTARRWILERHNLT